MGAKTSMLVYSNGDAPQVLAGTPELDREETGRFLRSLFPKDRLIPVDDGDLADTYPDRDQLFGARFRGVSVVAASEFALDRPSTLDPRFIARGHGTVLELHAMHSVVDWFAFARWENGKLVRSLSVAPDSGVIEDIGSRREFEKAYWAGEHPAVGDGESYPLPFHPLTLGEDALLEMCGYQLEGDEAKMLFAPESVPLARFARSRAWWRRWW